MAFVSVVLTVLSFAYQIYTANQARKRQKKAEKESAARADAAKGIKIPTETKQASVLLIFGRQLVGGNRVYHKTFNSYSHRVDSNNFVYFQNALNSSISGRKNEFLYYQQVVCFAGVSRCLSAMFDGLLYYDPKFCTVGNSDPEVEKDDGAGGLRVNFCRGGYMADPAMSAMDATRAKARFPEVAYATCIARVNRDDPQFGAVPDTRFFIEGMCVHTIIKSGDTYTLDTNTVYTNNPALCLLWYLMNKVYGRGLPVENVDLKTFYYAAKVCSRVIIDKMPVNGTYWKAATGMRQDIEPVEKGQYVWGTKYKAGEIVSAGDRSWQAWSDMLYDERNVGAFQLYTRYLIHNVVTYKGKLYRLKKAYIVTTIPENVFDGAGGGEGTGGFGESSDSDSDTAGGNSANDGGGAE